MGWMGLLSQTPLLHPRPPPLSRYTSTSSSSLPSASDAYKERCYTVYTVVAAAAAAAAAKKGKLVMCRCGKLDKSLFQSPTDKKQDKEEEEEDDDFKLLTAIRTSYNDIVILDSPKSRLLILDPTNSISSELKKERKWTGSYWDEFATLPPVVPEGPIAIFGLGGGTAAHLMLDLWPSLQLEGWEIDGILVDKARDYLGLSDLEQRTTDGGVLNIHIGDVFSHDASIFGGYAGIIVDLFAGGKILPQLEQADTWLSLYSKLMPNGRLMVNCAAGEDGLPATIGAPDHDVSSLGVPSKLNASIRALCKAFPGQVCWKKMPKAAGENYLALTGCLPDPVTWSAALPDELKSSVYQWRTCDICDG